MLNKTTFSHHMHPVRSCKALVGSHTSLSLYRFLDFPGEERGLTDLADPIAACSLLPPALPHFAQMPNGIGDMGLCCHSPEPKAPPFSRLTNLRPQTCRTKVRRVGRLASCNRAATSAKLFFETYRVDSIVREGE